MSGGVSLATIASYAAIGSAALSIGSKIFAGDKGGGASPQAPAAPNVAADDAASQDAARKSAVDRRRALASGGQRSLLATIGGAAGDTGPASIGIATANPATKTALGA